MIQADMHMHTCFSTDSQACPRDMAEEAVRKGLKTICFTDHFDKDDLEWGEEGIFDVDAYFTEMQKLQEEYEKKLNIRIGIELGLRTYLKEYYEKLTKKYPLFRLKKTPMEISSIQTLQRKSFSQTGQIRKLIV